MPELPTAVPLAAGLPRVLAEDDYASRLTAALDTVLAPAVGSYDNLTAYLDPGTAPPDFLAWLGHWVAAPPDEMGEAERTTALRSFVPAAAGLGARRGTAAALAEELGRLCGVDVVVDDPGGVSWSATPAAPSPAPQEPAVEVTVRGACDRALVRRLVRRATPAHLRVLVTFADEPVRPDHPEPPDHPYPHDHPYPRDQEET